MIYETENSVSAISGYVIDELNKTGSSADSTSMDNNGSSIDLTSIEENVCSIRYLKSEQLTVPQKLYLLNI